MDVNKIIKDIAVKVSDAYLKTQVSTNESIVKACSNRDDINNEILKRICELVNNNIYLTLFKKADTDRSNIEFEVADFDKVNTVIQALEAHMSDYDQEPGDFRNNIQAPKPAASGDVEKTASLRGTETVKTASLSEVVRMKERMGHMKSAFLTMKDMFARDAEESFIKMASDAKSLCVNGDSIADMAHLASGMAQTLGYGHDKIASAYSLIKKDLTGKGYKVNDQLTKVASATPDYDSEFFDPIEKFAHSIDAVAAADEMATVCDTIINALGEIKC